MNSPRDILHLIDRAHTFAASATYGGAAALGLVVEALTAVRRALRREMGV